ncbi:hypothetical protein [Amycolatopsis pigmentata]|uniref:Uncharacterized protein n=1 Tax=Amycolatopsis pigmentata TaxID=450801 RepID=A0ABW5FR04_9PSEU
MTANKNFKRRVRERARRTGESYTAALSHLRRLHSEEKLMRPDEWQRIEKTDFGYAVLIPQGWAERPPDLKNSPWETARFIDPSDRRHSMTVFRSPTRANRTAQEAAERVRPALESSGFTDFELSGSTLAERPAVLMKCARHDAGRVWTIHEYIAVVDMAVFCLVCGSIVVDEDAPLFEALVDGFELTG